MTADEIGAAERRFRERLERLLTPGQLAHYDAYQRRLVEQIARGDTAPLRMTPEEREVEELITADAAASGLRGQIDILNRITKPPQ